MNNIIKEEDEDGVLSVQELTDSNKKLVWGVISEIYNKYQLCRSDQVHFLVSADSNTVPSELDWIYGKEFLQKLQQIKVSRFDPVKKEGYRGYRVSLEIVDISAFIKIYNYLGSYLGHIENKNHFMDKDTFYISEECRSVLYSKNGVQKKVRLTPNQAKVINCLLKEHPIPRSMKYINSKVFKKDKKYLSEIFRNCKEYKDFIESKSKSDKEKNLYKISFKKIEEFY